MFFSRSKELLSVSAPRSPDSHAEGDLTVRHTMSMAHVMSMTHMMSMAHVMSMDIHFFFGLNFDDCRSS